MAFYDAREQAAVNMKKYFTTYFNFGQGLLALVTLVMMIGASSSIRAQGLDDALRLSKNELPIGTRAAGLNGAMIGTSGGFDALQWNPAAIAPNEFDEIGLSLYYRQHNSNAQFLGSTLGDNITTLSLGSLGLTSVSPTKRGHLVFGLSYDQVRDYTSSYSFSGVNPASSFLNTQGFVNDPGLGPNTQPNQSYLDQTNLAWQLHLTYNVPDSGVAKLTTPFKGGMLQSGTVSEEGGMHAIRGGAAIDIAEGVSVGAALNVYLGNYTYRRELNEKDIAGQFNSGDSTPLNFRSAQIVDSRDQQQTGVSLKLGLLAYQNQFVKFGATIETPSVYKVNDHFHRSGTSEFFHQSYTSTAAVEPDIVNSYTVTTPLKLGGGVSFSFLGATLLGSASYQDMSQLRFSDSPVDLSSLNNDARKNLRGVLAWQVGAEYVVPIAGLALRAGYGIEPSSYKNDPSAYDAKTLSFGASILMSKSFVLEAAYRHISYTTDHLLYNDVTVQGDPASAAINSDLVKRSEVSLGFGYRF
jgi:hypothetical protein